MIPWSSSVIIALASILVPKAFRTSWTREWHAELWHRAEQGSGPSELFRHARGAFRDAVWFRSSECAKPAPLQDTFFEKPLRLELSALAAALVFCAWAGVLSTPRPPYPNANRLVILQTGAGFLGGLDPNMSAMLAKYVVQEEAVQAIAGYRLLAGLLPSARVSRNFFDVLGVKPALGRTFADSDLETAAVVTDDLWRYRLHADPAIVGRTVRLPYGEFTVIGVLPRSFWFSSNRLWYYTTLPRSDRSFNAIALIKAGASIGSTQADVRNVARKLFPRWATNLELAPLADDPRSQDALFAASLGAIAAALGLLFLMIRGLGGPRYRLLLAARLFMLHVALAAVWIGCVRLIPGPRSAYSLFQLWFFFLICIACSCLVVRDHGGRCMVCFRRLRLPTPIGLWSSPILDQPGTEYVCPDGHGALYIAETRNAPDSWTMLDESWRDLFAEIPR